MTEQQTLGLRDRKRLRTRAQIEEAALALVLRDGLEATTVDAISERADISPRTFFNYFDSKDAAVLGLVPDTDDADEPSEDVLATLPTGTALDKVVALVASMMGGDADVDAGVRRDRIEVVRRHPEVLSGQLARLRARGDRLHATVEALLAADPAYADDPDRAARAELLLSLTGAAFRVAVREWAESGSRRPVSSIHQRAVALVTDTSRKLA